MKNSTEEKDRENRKVKFTLAKSKYVYMKLKMYVFFVLCSMCVVNVIHVAFSQRQTDGMWRDDDVQGQYNGMYEENVWVSGYGGLWV